MIDYTLILIEKYKNSYWSLNGESYEGLTWLSDSPKPSKEELDSQWEEVLSIIKKQNCKTQAKQLLSDSDWSEIPSVIEKLENFNEWKEYRMNIRKFIINPIENPIFPNKPETLWRVI
jgi:hypothetical protein